jgi:hypothetical protein
MSDKKDQEMRNKRIEDNRQHQIRKDKNAAPVKIVVERVKDPGKKK